MAHYIDSIALLLRRAGYEARQNAPLALIVLSIVIVVVLKDIDFRLLEFEATKYLIPGAVFFGSAVALLFEHLQSVRSTSKPDWSNKGAVFANRASSKPEESTELPKTVDTANLSKELQHLLSEEQIKRFHLLQIRHRCDGMIERLRDEIYRLGSRANLNLSLGAVVCLTGFVVLGYFVFVEEHSTDTAKALIEFAIRLSLVLFIEIFAYFFLNLYRGGLLDIKYFQNEITNATFRMMALEAALVKSDSATLKKICEEMSRTERNFILRKNETTYDLRQAELLMQHERHMSSTFEKLKNLMPKSASKVRSSAAAE